jgi:hypothetical protein
MRKNNFFMQAILSSLLIICDYGCSSQELLYKEKNESAQTLYKAKKGIFAAREYYRIEKFVEKKLYSTIDFECNVTSPCSLTMENNNYVYEPPIVFRKIDFDELGNQVVWRGVTQISNDSFFYFNNVIENCVNKNCQFIPVSDEEWFQLNKALAIKPINDSCCAAASIYLKEIIGFVHSKESSNSLNHR